MNRYLVTGGAGFIGSNLTAELLRRGESVRVLDNFSTGKRDNLILLRDQPAFELIEGDLRSFHTVRDAVKDIDYVLHQGALPSVPRSINDPLTTNDVSILGTLNVLEAAKEFGVRRVVYASSSSVYGNTEALSKREDMPISPMSPYALSKYTGERYCQIFTKLYGLETVCLRYFNVFGPNQDPSSQCSAVIPKFIKSISDNHSPVITGDGHQSRDFTFVANVVEANILACTAPNVAGEVMNVACGKGHTVVELVTSINLLMGKNISPEFHNERLGDVKHSMADIEKISRLMGYRVIIQFEEGLKRTILDMTGH